MGCSSVGGAVEGALEFTDNNTEVSCTPANYVNKLTDRLAGRPS